MQDAHSTQRRFAHLLFENWVGSNEGTRSTTKTHNNHRPIPAAWQDRLTPQRRGFCRDSEGQEMAMNACEAAEASLFVIVLGDAGCSRG